MAKHALINQFENVVKYNYCRFNARKMLENHFSDVPWMTEDEKANKKKALVVALEIPAPVPAVDIFSSDPVDKKFTRNVKDTYQIVDDRSMKAIWDIGSLDADFGEGSEVKLMSLIADKFLIPANLLLEADFEILTFKKSYFEDGKVKNMIDFQNYEWNDFVIMVFFNEVIVVLSYREQVSLERFVDGLSVVPAQMRNVEDILDYNDDE